MNIDRFKSKQEIYHNIALNELKNGKKESHWMWYIFPQVDGLGQSDMAEYYSIKTLEEVKEYISDSYLINNYLELCKVLLTLESNDAMEVFGYPDNLKLKSSLTLFYLVSNLDLIKQVLEKYYNGKYDLFTINVLINWDSKYKKVLK